MLTAKLSDAVLRSFRVIKQFDEKLAEISAIDFSTDGQHLVSCSKDDRIMTFDCNTGLLKAEVPSKKYGAGRIQYIHAKDMVIHTSTKINHNIRYLNLENNKYLRYYSGHSDTVTSLCASPCQINTFVSASLDDTVRLWDLRTSNYEGSINIPKRPVIAFDPDGLLFAVGINSANILLYDVRYFWKGPYATFNFVPENDCEWTRMKFSSDGTRILISTNGPIIRLVDTIHGTMRQTLLSIHNKPKIPLEASFSADSKYIVAGTTDGEVHVWNSNGGHKLCTLRDNHEEPVKCVQFNPKYMLLVTGSTKMSFWIPTELDPM